MIDYPGLRSTIALQLSDLKCGHLECIMNLSQTNQLLQQIAVEMCFTINIKWLKLSVAAAHTNLVGDTMMESSGLGSAIALQSSDLCEFQS